MAIAYGGVLGRVQGKIGAVVGASWKGIPTLREYNPINSSSSDAQTNTRMIYNRVTQWARRMPELFTQDFGNTFVRKMSGYNKLIQLNRNLFPASTNVNNIAVTSGSASSGVYNDNRFRVSVGTVPQNRTIYYSQNRGNGASTRGVLIKGLEQNSLTSEYDVIVNVSDLLGRKSPFQISAMSGNYEPGTQGNLIVIRNAGLPNMEIDIGFTISQYQYITDQTTPTKYLISQCIVRYRTAERIGKPIAISDSNSIVIGSSNN